VPHPQGPSPGPFEFALWPREALVQRTDVEGPDGALYASGGDGASFTFTDYGQDGNPLNPCGDPPGGAGGDCADIVGATSTTYAPTSIDVDFQDQSRRHRHQLGRLDLCHLGCYRSDQAIALADRSRQDFDHGPCRIRTCDLGIKSPLLYQLS